MKMTLEILPAKQRTLWAKLAGVEPSSGSFYLAGGTAAALHLKHRESIDYDFFHPASFDSEQLVERLEAVGHLSIESQTADTFVGLLSGVKVSYFAYPYPLIADPNEHQGIVVASLEDIAAMKIIAIGQRGLKKDFIDLHALISAGWNLHSIFRCVQRKYREREYNHVHLLKSLTYFRDAEDDPMPRMLKQVAWSRVKADLEQAAGEYIGRR